MKPIKMLGLAALAALMAMAFAGAGTAMATEPTALCLEDPGTGLHAACPANKLEEHVHEVTLPGAKAKLLSASLNVECDVLFLGFVLTPGLLSTPPEPLLISGEFVFTNCNNSCSFTEENGPAHIDVLKLAHELADVTPEFLLHLNCFGFINCRYNGVGLQAHALGPLLSTEINGAATLTGQEVNKESGSLCPGVTQLDITTTPLDQLKVWITE